MSNNELKKEEQMEEVLEQILNENVSVESFQEIAEKSLETAEYEKVNNLLLEYYNKKAGTNFQEVLKTELKMMVNEKMLSKLENSKDLEKSREEEINKIANEENVDKEILEKASKNLDEQGKNKENDEKEFDLRAELMKQVYIEEFKKYSNTLYRLKETQAYNRELTVGDKQGTQLVLYEKYLNNLEASYRGYANLNKLEESELNQNEEIKELKEKLEYDMGKKEEYIDTKVDKKLLDLKELYEKRQEVAKKISEMIDDKNISKEEFKNNMDYYQEEYRKLTYQMRDNDPTLEKYNEMIKIEQRNKEFAKNELGVNASVGMSAGYSKEQIRKDDPSKFTKTTEENMLDVQKAENVSQGKVLKDLIKEAKLCVNQGINDKAEEYIQSLEDMLEIKKNETKEAQGKQEKVKNEKLEKHMDKNVSHKTQEDVKNQKDNAKEAKSKDPLDYENPFDLRKTECEPEALSEDEITNKDKLNERLNKVMEKYYELYPEEKIEGKEQAEYVRTI